LQKIWVFVAPHAPATAKAGDAVLGFSFLLFFFSSSLLREK
jgi:hypothetical protein